jgi:hypothetical protein
VKPSIVIALIIVGGLLVVAPAVSDYFYRADLVRIMQHPGTVQVNLEGKMEDLYRVGCYALGCAMIVIAVRLAIVPQMRDQ